MTELLDILRLYFARKRLLEDAVKTSVKQYSEAYKKLEKYDKSTKKKAKLLADPEGSRNYFQGL